MMSVVALDAFNEQPHFIDLAEQLERFVGRCVVLGLFRLGGVVHQLTDNPCAAKNGLGIAGQHDLCNLRDQFSVFFSDDLRP